jgi:Lecithin:cholesterol acyltransferase
MPDTTFNTSLTTASNKQSVTPRPARSTKGESEPKDAKDVLVVLVPGALASKLTKDGKTIWTAGLIWTVYSFLFGGRTAGKQLDFLETPSEPILKPEPTDSKESSQAFTEPVELDETGRSFAKVDDQLPTRIGFGMGPFAAIKGFRPLKASLKEIGFPEDNVVVVPYDWRQSHAASAEFVYGKIRGHLNNRHTGLILIGHSMGGIVNRLILNEHSTSLKELGRDYKLDMAEISIATPWQGLVTAAKDLVVGIPVVFGRSQVHHAIRSFPSIAESVARYEGSLMAAKSKGSETQSETSPEENTILSNARLVKDAIRSKPGQDPFAFSKLDQHPDSTDCQLHIAGTGLPTPLRARITNESIEIVEPKFGYPRNEHSDGDGVVMYLPSREQKEMRFQTVEGIPHGLLPDKDCVLKIVACFIQKFLGGSCNGDAK